METGSPDERRYLSDVHRIADSLEMIEEAVRRHEARTSLESATKATEEAYEYQFVLRVRYESGWETFTYGPYKDEKCAGMLEGLQRQSQIGQAWEWKIQRRPTPEWVDYESGVN